MVNSGNEIITEVIVDISFPPSDYLKEKWNYVNDGTNNVVTNFGGRLEVGQISLIF